MKRIFFVLFAVAVVFGLCACNDSNTDTPSIEDISVNDISNDDTVPESSCAFESSSCVEDSDVSESVTVSENEDSENEDTEIDNSENDNSDSEIIEDDDISEEVSFVEESESDDSSYVSDDSDSAEEKEEIIEYTVSVKSIGGIALSSIDVAVYKDNELKDSAKTDGYGKVLFNLPESDDYLIVVSNVPKGYKVEKSYGFSDRASSISLESSLVMDEDILTTTLGVGDIMYDFTVVDADGNLIKLSEVLKTKKFVVLNYWFTSCHWCVEEFYVMEELYDDYKDDIAIVAINPINNADAVKAFRDSYGISFTMASCDYSWASVFGVRGYPTSVFIDRYGMICAVEVGAINTYDPWTRIFEHFTKDDYQQKIIYDLSELY
jgi:peroxiredoxin